MPNAGRLLMQCPYVVDSLKVRYHDKCASRDHVAIYKRHLQSTYYVSN